MCNDYLELRSLQDTSVTLSDEHIKLGKKQGIVESELSQHVEIGLLLCHPCKTWFPIIHGLPVLIPYMTPIHKEFSVNFRVWMAELDVPYDFPTAEPVSGEQFVMTSFSKEWLDYEYDGIIWSMNYDDHEKRFLCEVGCDAVPIDHAKTLFLEIGCGLGITTYLAHKNFEADAIGVDLSLAVLRASRQYMNNPFLHFVQASAFSLPFKHEVADIVYSHGVLHHTYSTYEAFKAIAPYCGPKGLLYIWVYGTDSMNASLLRRVAYCCERLMRPTLSRHSASGFARICLASAALTYMAINALHRLRNPHVQAYNYQRALHAARDRFTPLYAHRQDYSEVLRWFQEVSFSKIEKVDWHRMPVADQDNYKRNTGVRGEGKMERETGSSRA